VSLTEAEIRDRLMVAIGATSDIENIHVRRRAAKAAAPEVLVIIQEAAHELAEKQRREADDLHQTTPGVVQGLRMAADLVDPKRES
jgi:site-specific recombinase